MPRRHRGLIDHACYHLTHRCHRRDFLFRFARDRQSYTELLRETVKRFKVDVLNYVITSNHVHILVWVRRCEALPRAMQFLQGEFGQFYNQRKNREGAFWRDRYHSTLIENGPHLARCLTYIDLNMVRAGVVEHPRDWRFGGYHELVGTRQRYRILNVPRLIRCLGHQTVDVDRFRQWYSETLEQRLAAGELKREAHWTEAFAVGHQEWLGGIYRRFGFKRKKIRTTEDNQVKLEYNTQASPGTELAEDPELYYIEG